MGPAARSTRRRPHIGQRVRRQSETGRTPTWKRRETLSLEEHVGLFFRTCGKSDSVLQGLRVGFLKPIEHLILDDSISKAIHANSAKQGLARFASCVLQSGVELLYRAIKSNIADSLHVVIQIKRRPGRRYVSEVLEINSYDPDATPSITVRSTTYRSHPNDDGQKSKHEGHLSKRIHPYKLSSV